MDSKTTLASLFKAPAFSLPLLVQLVESLQKGSLALACESEKEKQILSLIKESPHLFPFCKVVGNHLVLYKNYLLEQSILESIQERKKTAPLFNEVVIEDPLLHKEQLQALQTLLSSGFSLLSGGPGTGKSHTCLSLIAHFQRLFQKKYGRDPKIIISAPTGKAAFSLIQKMDASTRKSVLWGTLHSLLKIHPTKQTPPPILAPDLFVIDEASMVDHVVFERLLKSLSIESALILMGDHHQLPSVIGGSIFYDLCQMSTIPLATLSKCHRTEGEVLILAARAICNGDADSFFALLEKKQESLCFHSLPQHPAPFFEANIILCATNQGPFGQETLNAFALEKIAGEDIPILATSNQFSLSVVNGQPGTWKEWKKGGYLLFDGNAHPTSSISYQPAFALSIHKSQGSEWDHVAIVLPPHLEHFGKELLYTAFTRARKKVSLYAEKKTLLEILQKDSYRHSLLKEIPC